MRAALLLTSALVAVVVTPVYAQPVNDNCVDAVPVDVPSITSGETLGASPTVVAPDCLIAVDPVGGVWFEIVGTGATLTASLCPADGGSADYDSKIHVYTGSCDDLQCVVANDDFCGLQSRVSWSSYAGQVYRILVSGFWDVGAFQLSVSDTSASHELMGPVKLVWEAFYDGPLGHDSGELVAVSSDGSKLYVTGESDGSAGHQEYATVAYEAGTGAELWTARDSAAPKTIAGSPDGSLVFVTGTFHGIWTDAYATVAYNAASGAQMWVARYNGDGDSSYQSGDDRPIALAVSPDGSMVFVTGTSWLSSSRVDYLTLAYCAATGAKIWESRYHRFPGDETPSSLAVSPDGSIVFVTGNSRTYSGHDPEAVTCAYDASSGDTLWVSRDESFSAGSLAVSLDSSTVFVTGSNRDYNRDFITHAYDSATGMEIWTAIYDGPGSLEDSARSIVVGPDGSKVFVTGTSAVADSGYLWVSVAYDATAGDEIWVSRYDETLGHALSFVESPDASTVFMTGHILDSGYDRDFVAEAYAMATGDKIWTVRFDASGDDVGRSIGVSPDGSTVYVTGVSTNPFMSNRDYATMAYLSGFAPDIDVKPRKHPNYIDPESRNLIPVALMGSEHFDVENVDRATLRFGPEAAEPASHAGPPRDINFDGYKDKISFYRLQETGIACGDTEAMVIGELYDGRPFEGTDEIVTVGCGASPWEPPAIQPDDRVVLPHPSVFGGR